ncbi:hypothetical protein [Corynebacterium alimapuense]|uniref:Uncharacterized protein n=1 Tax=Corynebacterium alimapuense TaxID=1576874 RepID=A0A3M8K4R6_9CORY|nr:hypothetical protein [Corynebacterium alimapuense]RNE48217.1 hypothetical protein C5L39_10155 [Corynebacterium alimapuense]
MFGRSKGFDPDKDQYEGRFIAAEQTDLPLNGLMTRIVAQELPILDSHDRTIVYRLLREYAESGGPEITSQEELPAQIREIMNL